MGISYKNLDHETRRLMVEEIRAGNHYVSPRLTVNGRLKWPALLEEAAANHDDDWLSVATSRSFKAADGSKTTETEWTSVVAWGRLADRVEKLLAKGAYILVQGEKRTRTYTDGNGVEHTIVEMVAADLRLLAKKSAN